MRYIWIGGGLTALSLGLIGILLPLLPTVPFLLLAALCFSKSSEKLHQWLVSHPKFGPPIDDWNENGAISHRAKILATASVIAAFTLSVVLDLRPLVLLIQALCLSGVMLFLWTRPNA